MRYVPVPSETAFLVFSMSAGLDASTVTPGSTAPDASFTTPAMEAWAYATAGTNTSSAIAANPACNLRMHFSLRSYELSGDLTTGEMRDQLLEVASRVRSAFDSTSRIVR